MRAVYSWLAIIGHINLAWILSSSPAHHVYKKRTDSSSWECKRETDNSSDPYAVAILKTLQSLDTSLEEFRSLVLSFFTVMALQFVEVQGAIPLTYPREAYQFPNILRLSLQ